MRAKYCKCKNTYTIKGCKSRKCKTPYYWSQGIGSIHINNHVSTILNQDTERVEIHNISIPALLSALQARADYYGNVDCTIDTLEEDVYVGGSVTNIDTTRTINN